MKVERDDCYVWSAVRRADRGGCRSTSRRAVFLDRDGTINVEPKAGHYIRDTRRLTLLPGAARAIRMINRSGVLAVVVSNQRWLSSAGVEPLSFRPLDERLRSLLEETEGAYLDACYVCPHRLASCACRKPAPGMLLRAANDLGVDLRRSVVIGDSASDVAAGRAVGARCALLVKDRGSVAVPPGADRIFPTLYEAVKWALQA
jgi:D-glycero-D-manno-heptose 1,7-bisphosphate phosphatase